MARDKQKLSEFAMLHEIPVPKEFKHDEIDCNCFPLIVKPKIGSGATGIYYVDTYEQWLKLNIDLNDYLIQEQISNSSKIEGGFFLFHNGKYVSYYGHERLRTYPVKGGISIYSKTKYNARVKFLGTNLLEHLHWSGFAMVEFIFDEKINDYKLIEINPRLWGSFMLSEFSGADFISNYINIIYNKPVTESYFNQNSYIRWIFPFDILYYIKKRFRITGFWKYQQNTCYINFTYSKWYKSLYFILLSIFNLKVLQKLRHKIM
jgi:predicted ATP-grasp superfamily ATP-dependent carboligase